MISVTTVRSRIARLGGQFSSLRRRAAGRMASSPTRRLNRFTPPALSAGIGALGGAAGTYFLDPDSGRRRRAIARDRTAGLVRRGYRRLTGRAETAARMAHDQAVGAAHEARRSVEPERSPANDQELADRVRTELFRPAEVPKGSISVNAETGVVYLRGEVKRPEQINDLVRRAEEVEGVRAVHSLLHVPGQPAPMKQETEHETRRRVLGLRRR